MEGNHRVTVGVRIRPPSAEDPLFLTSADRVFSWQNNREIYSELVYPRIKDLSYSTIFTYGRTGSGKTYTMFGDDSCEGIVGLLLSDLVCKRKAVSVRCIEIYNENAIELLTGEEVKLLQEGTEMKILSNHRTVVSDGEGITSLLKSVRDRRRITQTEYNEQSSRSHTIIEVTSSDLLINLVDLAGNEKLALDSTRKKEGSMINKSLLALGKVIDQLHEGGRHVSYRESKLTRILQGTLSAGTIICICTVVTLGDLQTVKFAERLKRIKVAERRMKKTKDDVIKDLQQRIEELTTEIVRLREKREESSVLAASEPQTQARCFGELEGPTVEEIIQPEEGAGALMSFVSDSEDLLSLSPPSGPRISELISAESARRPRVDLYEMLYFYFKHGVSRELANTLTERELSKVKVTLTSETERVINGEKYTRIVKESRTRLRRHPGE